MKKYSLTILIAFAFLFSAETESKDFAAPDSRPPSCETVLGHSRYPDMAYNVGPNLQIIDYTPDSIPGPSLVSEFGFLVGNREMIGQTDSSLRTRGLLLNGDVHAGLCASTCAANIGFAIYRYMRSSANHLNAPDTVESIVRLFDRIGQDARLGIGHGDLPLMWPAVIDKLKVEIQATTNTVKEKNLSGFRMGLNEIWLAGVSAGEGMGHAIVILRKTPEHLVFWDPNDPTLIYRSKHRTTRVGGFDVLEFFLASDSGQERKYKLISLTRVKVPADNALADPQILRTIESKLNGD